MPVTIWLNDSVPTVHIDNWRLTIADESEVRELGMADLAEPAV